MSSTDNRARLASDSAPPRTSSIDVRETHTSDSLLLAAVMGSAGSALLLTNARGVVMSANPSFELMTGLSSGDLADRPAIDVLAPGQDATAHAIRRAATQGNVWQGDVSIVARDGGPLALRIKVSPVRGETGGEGFSHLVIEARDEGRKRVLAELDPEVQTMARLSSSIAHDFNNQLSVIINYTHILSRQVPKDSPLQAHLHDMQTTAWRATKLAQQLIVLGRRPMAEPQNLNLNQVISNLAPLLRTMLGERVKVRMTLEPALWSVHMALPQAEQVLVNLAVNAREAMLGAGDVELTTANVTLRADDPDRPADLPAGRYVRFTLSEHASHIDPATITPVDASTPLSGLGPTMIYRAVQQAGGSLGLHATDDGGMTFRIHVPAVIAERDSANEVGAIRTLS